jgi:branched-chain amino acid transport system substrate-binding protein
MPGIQSAHFLKLSIAGCRAFGLTRSVRIIIDEHLYLGFFILHEKEVRTMVQQRLIRLVVFSVIGIFLSAGLGFAADTIKLGVAGPHSGDLASYGIPTVKAAELVVKAVNAKGGVLGKKVELLVEDDVCKPEVATNTATKMVSEKADVVLGHICSGATKAALGIYRNSKIIAMSPSATNPALTQSGDYPNFFRTIASDDAQARLEVDFALDTLKLKKIAVLHDKGDYGKGLAEFAKMFLEEDKRAEVVLYEGITPGAVDYSAIVQKIKRTGAEAVIFGGYHPEASKIVSQMRKKRMKTIFISDDGVKDDTFIKVAGKYAEGVYATGPKDVSDNPMAVAANEAHKKAYGADPGAFYLNAYSAALALLNAIEKAGSTDYDALIKALQTDYVDTPLGKIRFDKKGDATGVGFSVYQVQKGAYVEIK